MNIISDISDMPTMGTTVDAGDPPTRVWFHPAGGPGGGVQVWAQYQIPASMIGGSGDWPVWSAPLSMASVPGGPPTRAPHAFNVAAEATYIEAGARLWFADGTQGGGTPVWRAADDPSITAP